MEEAKDINSTPSLELEDVENKSHLDDNYNEKHPLLESVMNNNNRTENGSYIEHVSSSDSSTSTLTPHSRLEGDNISLASTTSSLSTSSIATTDSSTISDAAKRQSVSSLSDLEHLGEFLSNGLCKWYLSGERDYVLLLKEYLFM